MKIYSVSVQLSWQGDVLANSEKEAHSIAQDRGAEFGAVVSSVIEGVKEIEATHVDPPENTSIFCTRCMDQFLGVGKCLEHDAWGRLGK